MRGLACLAILHQPDAEQQPLAAHIAVPFVSPLEPNQTVHQALPHRVGIRGEPPAPLGAHPHLPPDSCPWPPPLVPRMLPPPSPLCGSSIVLVVLAVLFTTADKPGWTPFVFAGVVTGLSPAFQVHSYGTAVVLAAFWASFHRRREWAGFFIPALVLGIPAVLWLLPESGSSLRIQIGWMAMAGGHRDTVLWF